MSFEKGMGLERYRVVALGKDGARLHDDLVVGPEDAWARARSQSLDVDVQTIRIIDGEDYINVEWDREKGIVYPAELAGRKFPRPEVKSS